MHRDGNILSVFTIGLGLIIDFFLVVDLDFGVDYVLVVDLGIGVNFDFDVDLSFGVDFDFVEDLGFGVDFDFVFSLLCSLLFQFLFFVLPCKFFLELLANFITSSLLRILNDLFLTPSVPLLFFRLHLFHALYVLFVYFFLHSLGEDFSHFLTHCDLFLTNCDLLVFFFRDLFHHFWVVRFKLLYLLLESCDFFSLLIALQVLFLSELFNILFTGRPSFLDLGIGSLHDDSLQVTLYLLAVLVQLFVSLLLSCGGFLLVVGHFLGIKVMLAKDFILLFVSLDVVVALLLRKFHLPSQLAYLALQLNHCKPLAQKFRVLALYARNRERIVVLDFLTTRYGIASSSLHFWGLHIFGQRCRDCLQGWW